MSSTLYHYCSLESFQNIIISKRVRLSNVFKTNDSLELKWIFQLMEEAKKFDPVYILKLRYIYELGLKDFFRPHMICFSQDGDILSQWRAYAKDGNGISIGFNREYFESNKEANPNLEFKIYNVIYSKKNQEIALQKTLQKLMPESEIDQLISSDLHFARNFLPLVEVSKDLFKLGIKFKNPSFAEEREIRIVHGYPELAAEPDLFQYRSTENNLISYVEIPIDNNIRYLLIIILMYLVSMRL